MKMYKNDWRDIFKIGTMAMDPRKLFLALVGTIFSFCFVLIFVSLCRFNFNFSKTFNWVIYVFPLYSIDEIFINLKEFLWSNALPHNERIIRLLSVIVGVDIIIWMIWSYFGTAISRITVVEFVKDEKISIKQALEYGLKKYPSAFRAGLGVYLGFLFFFLCVVVVSLLARIPYLGYMQVTVDHIVPSVFTILLVLFYPLALIAGFIMVLILLGGIFAWPMFLPTLAVENTDAFDAISRSFNYLMGKPWHYIWYQLVNLIYGTVVTLFVWLFGGLMYIITSIAIRIGTGESVYESLSLLQRGPNIANVILFTWLFIFFGMILMYAKSYFFTSQTVIYLLMRKRVDDIEYEDIYEDDEYKEEFGFEEDLTQKNENTSKEGNTTVN